MRALARYLRGGRRSAARLAICALLAAGCGSEWSERSKIRVAACSPSEVFVFSGTGRLLRVFDRSKRSVEQPWLYAFRYYEPTVSPDSTTLILPAVHGYNPQTQDIAESDESYSLHRIDLDSWKDAVILTSGTDRPIHMPTWHPSGEFIALFLGEDLVFIDRDGVTISSTPLPEVQLGKRPNLYQGHREEFMRWDQRGELLYICANGPPRKNYDRDIGAFNPATGTITWTDLKTPTFTHGRYTPVGRYGRVWNDPAYLALFGSVENPAWAPVYMNDGGYYFYLVRKEGFFPKGWVEGYARQSNRTFKVGTLWRGLYAE